MFLTYPEYTALGYSQISEADFPRLERQAAQYIRSRTFNRAKLGVGWDDELKEATALIATHIDSDEFCGLVSVKGTGRVGVVASESKDGWSVSYNTPDLKTALLLSANQKQGILHDWLFLSGWLSAVISTCPPRSIFPPLPGPKPPVEPEPPGGGEDMALKHCDVYYLLGNFQGGFDTLGNTLTFPGGPVRYDCMIGSDEVTIEGKTINFAHGQWITINVKTGAVDAGAWPTDNDVYVCGYMHNNGTKKIIEVFGMGTQVFNG